MSWSVGESGRQIYAGRVNGSGAGASDIVIGIPIPPETFWILDFRVLGIRPGVAEWALYRFNCIVRRAGLGAATFTTVPSGGGAEIDATADATIAVVANNLQVTGVAPAAKTYNWVAEAELMLEGAAPSV